MTEMMIKGYISVTYITKFTSFLIFQVLNSKKDAESFVQEKQESSMPANIDICLLYPSDCGVKTKLRKVMLLHKFGLYEVHKWSLILYRSGRQIGPPPKNCSLFECIHRVQWEVRILKKTWNKNTNDPLWSTVCLCGVSDTWSWITTEQAGT